MDSRPRIQRNQGQRALPIQAGRGHGAGQREMMQRGTAMAWGIHERHMNALRMFKLLIYL